MAETILIVEDDPHVLLSYEEILKSTGYAVVKAESGEAAERILRTSSIDLAITDLKMPKMGGLEVLRIARNVDPETIVILITAYPTVDTAVEAMKFGACDYLVKPFSVEQLRGAVKDALEKRKTKEAYGLLKGQLRSAFAVSGIVGQSRGILKLLDEIRKVASVSANVLILGESGVGKELVAQAIHMNSSRKGGPFVPLNCAAIPETLLEAELFGYERGAFTGAQVSKEGFLEAANGGTLFLDEFCELSPALQAKLLRTLEEGAVCRLGGRKPLPFDVRFMASTNRDIHEEIRHAQFRPDLLFPRHLIQICVPPLQERREDVPLLVAHFLEESSNGSGRRSKASRPRRWSG